MQDNWYENNTSNESGWHAPAESREVKATPPLSKKKRRLRVISIVLIVALVLGGMAYFYSRMFKMIESFLEDTGFPGTEEIPVLPELPDIGESNFTLPKDYRDYFDQYYSPVAEAEDCTIPRVAMYEDSIDLPLTGKGLKPLSYPEIYAKCAPTVVAIHAYPDAENTDGFFWGTGFIIHSDGYIVTNSHIIEGTSRADVTLWDDRVFEALLVGYDSRNDLAVLKIDAEKLPVAEFCDSDDMQIGESVVAIGNPLGEQFRSTMTEGIVSGIGRAVSYNGSTLELLQTSAPLNEGNSGGPLINLYGQVIGITNMKMNSSYGNVSIEGVGFAIPSRTVKELTDAILASGEVTGRPALGIVVGGIPEAAREHYKLPVGLYISEVKHGSDCEAKGLQVGDILMNVNGETVTETQHVLDKIKPLSVGDALEMSIWRDGKTFDVTVTLVDMNQVY